MKKIFITGGAGYVGSKLVPKLLSLNYEVTIFDLMIYGENVLDDHIKLKKIKGDIRDINLLEKYLPGNDVLIHLAWDGLPNFIDTIHIEKNLFSISLL